MASQRNKFNIYITQYKESGATEGYLVESVKSKEAMFTHVRGLPDEWWNQSRVSVERYLHAYPAEKATLIASKVPRQEVNAVIQLSLLLNGAN